MSEPTFITGNQGKADFLAKFLGHPVKHHKLDLEEIQSLDLREVAEYKLDKAYQKINGPVIVEDMGLSFTALGRLPGTMTKWFMEELGCEGLCRLLDGYKTREATGRVCFGYRDANQTKFFEGEVHGVVPDHPMGTGGYGWDSIFIPKEADKTYAQMNDKELKKFSLRATTVFPQIKKFLASLD